MIKAVWLSLRAVLALLLTLGYLGLVLALTGVLFLIPLWVAKHWPGAAIKVAAPCIGAALALLFSAFPRQASFEVPGLPLNPARHPRLFEFLKSAAVAMSQRVPTEVYLAPLANAAVTKRGGIWGIGGHRIMLIGYPLMQGLTLNQFRATVAHEFGHYAGHDVLLGHWIWTARDAIEKTIRTLDEGQWLLKAPFYLYGRLFLLVTQSVFRQEEFMADERAAETVGTWQSVESLKAVYQASLAFEVFLELEMRPAVAAGFRPPLGEGFARFLKSSNLQDKLRSAARGMMAQERSSLYDSHPVMRERITALQKMPMGSQERDSSRASDLIALSPELDQDLTAFRFPSTTKRLLKNTSWEKVTQLLYVPDWEALARTCSKALRGLTPASLADLCTQQEKISVRFSDLGEEQPVPEKPFELGCSAIGAALCLVLQRRGWTVSTDPGKPVTVQNDRGAIEPFFLVQRLCKGEISREKWLEGCQMLGISDFNLGERHFEAAGRTEF